MKRQRLAALLYEELARGNWGAVDPRWIRMVAEDRHVEGDDCHDQAEALGEVFERVITRLQRELS